MQAQPPLPGCGRAPGCGAAGAGATRCRTRARALNNVRGARRVPFPFPAHCIQGHTARQKAHQQGPMAERGSTYAFGCKNAHTLFVAAIAQGRESETERGRAREREGARESEAEAESDRGRDRKREEGETGRGRREAAC